MQSLTEIHYKNEFVDTFEGDQSGSIHPRQTPGVFYSRVAPTPVKKPVLIGWSDDLAADLNISKPSRQDEIDLLGGNFVSPAMAPYAARYGGHQFGHWAGQLGDGRAITLAEYESSGKTVELQLKGSGPTAYSRRADGRAVLRSSVREYLMSEAMHHLGVPTTRALSLVATGDDVMRDMFYNGNPQYEPGAIVMRVAPSFLRFGNFEILAATNEIDNLRKLTEWTLARYYPHLQGENKLIDWLKEVVDRTATMIVEWLRVGFVHGVMNTDNMSILGLTIDYGPFSFLDDYDPKFTPNTTDLPGRRYAFGQQASIGYWNLGCLANAIAPLVEQREALVEAVESYEDLFWLKYYSMMGNKLGLDKINEEDIGLIDEFEKVLSDVKPDMAIFYQLLIDIPREFPDEELLLKHFQPALYGDVSNEQGKAMFQLLTKYLQRLNANVGSRAESVALMKKANPRFILRNYLLHEAIEELEKGGNTLFKKLEHALKTPYSDSHDEFFRKRPDWAGQKAGCSMLSCSS